MLVLAVLLSPYLLSPRWHYRAYVSWEGLWGNLLPQIHASSLYPITVLCLLTSSWSGLNTGTTFTSVSLVPFGLWGYYSGIHYWSPQIPAICLGSSSPLCFLESQDSPHPLVPSLGYRNSWITCFTYSDLGEPAAFSQAICLASTFHKCSIFTTVACWTRCQFKCGTSSRHVTPRLYLRKQTSLSPPMLLWPSTLLYARGMEIIIMLVSDLLLLLQPSSPFHAPRSRKGQNASGPSHRQKGLSHPAVCRRNHVQALDIGSRKQ